MRVGIVGSGIAGLVAAYQCRQEGHEVSLLERQANPGMSAYEFRYADQGEPLIADVPSRMFNRRLWPRLYSLYRRLGVGVEAVNPSQCFFSDADSVYLQLPNANQPWRHLSTWKHRRGRELLWEARRLQQMGGKDLDAGRVKGSFGDYLRQREFQPDFIDGFLYPILSSTVCTCSYAALDRYPAVILLETLRLLSAGDDARSDEPLLWRSREGTRYVVERLLEPGVTVATSRAVSEVTRLEQGVQVRHAPVADPDHLVEETFDHVILATQANTTLRLVSDLTNPERSMLERFRYESVAVDLHRDVGLLPRNRKSWSTFNQLVDMTTRQSRCTVWLNPFHQWPAGVSDLFQTIGVGEFPEPDDVMHRVRVQRPVVDEHSGGGWSERIRLHGQADRRLWFCGSYATPGVPLLETAVRSVEDLPWLKSEAPTPQPVGDMR